MSLFLTVFLFSHIDLISLLFQRFQINVFIIVFTVGTTYYVNEYVFMLLMFMYKKDLHSQRPHASRSEPSLCTLATEEKN